MGNPTSMYMNIEFNSEDGASKAYERLQEYKEKENRSCMVLHDNGKTSVAVEDNYDRMRDDKYFKNELMALFKDCDVQELSCDLEQTTRSYFFDNSEDLEEFTESN